MKNLKRRVCLIRPLVAALLALALPVLAACGGGDPTLTVYSGRFESLIAPLVYSFSVQTGIEVNVTYSSNDAIVVKLLEEGTDTPADVVLLHETTGWRDYPKQVSFPRCPKSYWARWTPSSAPPVTTGWERQVGHTPLCTTSQASIPSKTCQTPSPGLSTQRGTAA